jgi:hypothetical protein
MVGRRQTGRFPKPFKLGPLTTVWRVEDIRALMERLTYSPEDLDPVCKRSVDKSGLRRTTRRTSVAKRGGVDAAAEKAAREAVKSAGRDCSTAEQF